jgi:hypothetical protein
VTEIPDGDDSGILSHSSQENTVLRKEQTLDRTRRGIVRSRCARCGVEDFDLPVNATRSNEVTIRVEVNR